VIRRVRDERLEDCFVLRRPIFAYPRLTVAPKRVAQHIDDGHRAEHGAKQLRALHRHGDDEETAVGAAVDGETLGLRVTAFHEVLGSHNEVVEDAASS